MRSLPGVIGSNRWSVHSSMEGWHASEKSNHYWDLIRWYETRIPIFIRAHRQGQSSLYVEVMGQLVPMCFAIDHANYARWLSVHIRDMNSLPESTKEFQEHDHWVISKINNRKPKRERLRCLYLTPVAFRRWMLSGPELWRLQTQFEGEYLLDDDPEHSTNLQNHEQALSSQTNFQRQVDSLSNTIQKWGTHSWNDTGKTQY
jgi:hypothetical protein